MSETTKKSWRPGLMTWLVIGGLVLINASVFLNNDGDSQATRRFLHYFNPYHWPTWYSTNLWLVFTGLLTAWILKNTRVQSALHSFYASRFWHSTKSRFKKSQPNMAVVHFVLRRKFGKWLLRKWSTFWSSIKIERYPAYSWVFAFVVIFTVFFMSATLMATPRLYLWYFVVIPGQFIYYVIYVPFYLGPLVEFNLNGTISWRLFITPTTGLLLVIWLLRIASKSKKKGKAS